MSIVDLPSPARPYPYPDAAFAQIERRAELLRLQQIVVDVAKRWTKAILEGAHEQIAADNELREAVDALEQFESEHLAEKD